jgi:hypothetical protein
MTMRREGGVFILQFLKRQEIGGRKARDHRSFTVPTGKSPGRPFYE